VEELQIPHKGNEPPGIVTLSVGVAAISTGDATDADDLLKQADDALYRAKEAGRNRVASHGNGG
jgi:diguanylate cyclase (GGDEF)-like protein